MPAATPWTKVGDWSPATNTPTLPVVPTITSSQYYEATSDGTFLGIPFNEGDYLWAIGTSWQRLDQNDPFAKLIKEWRIYLNGLIDDGTDALNAHGGRINTLENNLPVRITGFTGGSQASSVVTLADVTGSSMNLLSDTWYDIEWLVTYSAAATTTGAFFSVNGTAAGDYFRAEVIGDSLAADGNARVFSAPGGGQAFPSSRATSGNKALIRVRIHTTSAGTAVLRFASELASAITITALQGYSQRLP